MVFVVVVVFVYKYLSVVFSFEILIPKTQLRNTISMVWHVVQAKWVNVQTYIYRWKRIYWRIRKTVISRIPMDIVCAYLYMWVSDRLLKNYIFYGFGWCVVYLVKFFICSFSPRAHFNSFRFVHISNVYASSRPSSVFIYAHPEVQNQRPYGVNETNKKKATMHQLEKIFSKVWS